MQELLAQVRIRPGLFVGLSLRKWRHRKMLHWLYDERSAPANSLSILTPSANPSEAGVWDSGGWLEGTGRIAVITEDPVQLAPLLLDAAAARESA